jgi:LmbE family N-acetylglucosaminyl deacetylase
MNTYPRLDTAAGRERILIVAPHVDDEAIGAGGYAIDAIANGAEVWVVYLTAGDCSKVAARLVNKRLAPTPASYLNVGRARIREAKQAMELIGVPHDHFFILGYPDRGLDDILTNRTAVVRSLGTGQTAVPYEEALAPGADYTFDNLMRDLQHVVDLADPTIVIAPVAFDRHSDHRAAAELTDLALANSDAQRYGYLVHTRLIPTALVSTPQRALLPPSRMQQFSWTTYSLTENVRQMKTTLLMTYKSQRPYVFLLRNAFVRKNELFFLYPER